MRLRLLFFILAISLLLPTTVLALTLGENITISDNVTSAGAWYGDHEDQEVEPGCVTGQQWDLEGFFLNGTTLTLVSGFNLKEGIDDPYGRPDPSGGILHYDSGDIFIDINGDAVWGQDVEDGSGNETSNEKYKYDYAIDLNFASNTYSVYALNNDTLLRVYFNQNDESNPWELASPGSLTPAETGTIEWHSGLTDANVGLLGGTHYAVEILDISWLTGLTDYHGFLAHFTYECGNDNLIGEKVIPGGDTEIPDAFSVFLLGSASLIGGLAGFRRRRKQ